MLPFQERTNPFADEGRLLAKPIKTTSKLDLMHQIMHNASNQHTKLKNACALCLHEVVDQFNDSLIDKTTIPMEDMQDALRECKRCSKLVCTNCMLICDKCEEACCKLCCVDDNESLICDNCKESNN